MSRGRSNPRLYTALRWALALAVVAAILLVAVDALARPGGGHGYSGGGRGGGFSGRGGGGGDGDALVLLVWLAIEHPVIGIPLLVGFGLVWMLRKRSARTEHDWATSMHAGPGFQGASPAVSPRRTLERIRQFDPDFSVIVFEDFLYGLYQKAQELRGRGKLASFSAYMNEQPRQSLTERAGDLQSVRGVVVGSMHYLGVKGLEADANQITVQVAFDANYTEVKADGSEQAWFVVEHWTVSRSRQARSRPPDRARTFECPSCGAPLEGIEGGQCAYCGNQVDTGAFDWVVTKASLVRAEPRPPALTADVEEQGTMLPTVQDPQAERRLAQLGERDPSFSWEAFTARVTHMHGELGRAWSALQPEGLRPYVSDSLFETQLYWLEAYRQAGLRNVVDQAQVTGIELATVTSDRYFDSITVRLYATSLDYTIRQKDGKVVSGSKRKKRPYSEYWTLIRATSTQGEARSDANCPNCGAPLEVNQGGSCQYCQARVTTGEFDWVLSRIEQDESYRG